MEPRYFLVSHRFMSDTMFRQYANSKNKVRNMLPRFCTNTNEYKSLWNIEEVSKERYDSLSDLKDAPYKKEFP